MLHNPYKIVQMFEEEVAYYTGAPYAISLNSCTNALFLACKYLNVEGKEVIIPGGNFLFEKDDLVVLLSSRDQLKEIEDIFSIV